MSRQLFATGDPAEEEFKNRVRAEFFEFASVNATGEDIANAAPNQWKYVVKRFFAEKYPTLSGPIVKEMYKECMCADAWIGSGDAQCDDLADWEEAIDRAEFERAEAAAEAPTGVSLDLGADFFERVAPRRSPRRRRMEEDE